MKKENDQQSVPAEKEVPTSRKNPVAVKLGRGCSIGTIQRGGGERGGK